MKRTMLRMCALMLLAQPLGAEMLLHRVDGASQHNAPATAVFTKYGEAWVFNYDSPTNLRLELGKLWSVGKSWNLGVYGVIWPGSGRTAILPWVQYDGRTLGGARLNANLATYIPLRRYGNLSVLADPVALTWKLGSGWGVGAAASLWWPTKEAAELRAGPMLQKQVGRLNLSLRWLPLGVLGKGGQSWRLDSTVSF